MLRTFHWSWEAGVPILAGLVWLWYAYSFGIVGFVFAVIPGCLLLSAGTSALLYPGDSRITQFIALGGVLGTLLSLPALLVASPWAGLLLILLSVASFLCAGYISMLQEPLIEEVPAPQRSVRLAAEMALDESTLAFQLAVAPVLTEGDPVTVRREVDEALELFEAKGWLNNPAGYHRTPPPLESLVVESCESGTLEFEHLCFESGYEPHPDEPGRDRWLRYQPNRTAHAWILCHKNLSRPWVVGIHGYGMGIPRTFFRIFQAERLHKELGLNLAFPILPYHGPRKVGRWHGQGFGSGDVMDFIHAEAQAMWDIRRLLTWIRAQSQRKIGLGGVSLGGYNTALLSCLEADFACAIAGLPATDFIRQAVRHAPALHLRQVSQKGLDYEMVNRAISVVSPLVLVPRVPKEQRYIFGAVGDRLIHASQVRDLWLHWDRPHILWYQGSHVTFNYHPEVIGFIGDALRASRLWSRG